MALDVWRLSAATRQITAIGGRLLRIVESQEQVATTRLVDGLDKQAVLEELLEATKPPPRAGSERLHYLLATPFRYPPLRHGSRYGRRHEPSLFYGALSLRTLLAEAAYYRFVFWFGMAESPPTRLATQHAVFEVRYRCAEGLRLQGSPFDAWRAELADPSDYAATQALGSAMRAAGIGAFEYPSARDPEGGNNVALFTPKALAQRRPDRIEPWLAETTADHVHFSGHGREVHRYDRSLFEIGGRLPLPAL